MDTKKSNIRSFITAMFGGMAASRIEQLIREERSARHVSNPVYFPPKRALRGNCKYLKARK